MTMSASKSRPPASRTPVTLPLRTLDALYGDGGADLDAMGAMLGFIKARDVFTSHAREHSGQRLQHRDRLAELRQHCRRLEADIIRRQ